MPTFYNCTAIITITHVHHREPHHPASGDAAGLDNAQSSRPAFAHDKCGRWARACYAGEAQGGQRQGQRHRRPSTPASMPHRGSRGCVARRDRWQYSAACDPARGAWVALMSQLLATSRGGRPCGVRAVCGPGARRRRARRPSSRTRRGGGRRSRWRGKGGQGPAIMNRYLRCYDSV